MEKFKHIIFDTDSYKVSMHKQYPPNTTGVYSYIESRGGKWDKTLFFGLQGFIKEYLTKKLTQKDIDLAEKIWKAHGLPFSRENWQYILDHHDGRLPVVIRAVPEGTVIAGKNVLVTIENTDPKCYWLTTWIETALLRAVWYPTTVATLSYSARKRILHYLELTGTPEDIDFKLHDFGARGCSSRETASIGGAAHLLNFKSTDTIQGVLYAMSYYDSDVCGFSIPASEHSTMTSWGREFEKDAYENMIDQFAQPGSIFAVVSDSYDIFNATENIWGEQLKKKVIDSGSTVVIRPDSGDPLMVIKRMLKILDKKFGSTINSKGYRVLNHVKIIQGDGVNEQAIYSILGALMVNGWSADNIAFGMGGALLQGVGRDDLKFALKCSSACVNDEWIDVQKDPITDQGKKSKAGRVQTFRLGLNNEYYSATEKTTIFDSDAMSTVFENGYIMREYNFDEVKSNIIH